MRQSFISLLGFCLMVSLGCTSVSHYVNENSTDWENRLPPPSEEVLYKVYLIGDAGSPSEAYIEPTLELLSRQLEEEGPQSAAIFLGDNLYPSGMPDSLSPDRPEAERRMRQQLDAVKNFAGKIFFIPGNHGWEGGGAESLKRQEVFVEDYLGRGNVFLPDDGFPGPVEVELMDNDEHPDLREDIRLVILDTQWWLQGKGKPYGDTGEYELQDAGDFLRELENVLLDRRNDHVMVLGHHPLFSNGRHGGYFPLKTHLAPPVFGSLYVGYRKFFGNPQDISNHRYAQLKEELLQLFIQHQDLIYAAGHEHGLQYFEKERKNIRQHYVVSGTGSKRHYITKGHGASYASDKKGYAVVSYYTDGSSWLEFWEPRGDGSQGSLLFRTRMGEPYADPFSNRKADIREEAVSDYSDSTVTKAANTTYNQAGWLTRMIAGSHNRKLWDIPVEVPALNIGNIDGGLRATEVGGTGQSTTLRLEAGNGQEYVLRSVNKQAGRIWSEDLRNTFAQDIAQDQFSIVHPYSAFVLPKLADAVNVYHTNPKLYYVPEDPRLGRFSELMAGEFALFEERPDDDMKHVESMGRSEEVLGTRQMLLEVDADIDHRVDQHAFARARLFDLLIADWDRHPDQWRWGSFEPPDGKGKIYRPIPRDRDMAFMRMNGLIPTLGKLDFFYQYQDFRPKYGNIKGLTQNALGQTRRFTNQMTKEAWTVLADSMKQELSDTVIERAIRLWPEPVFEVDGSRTIETLKARRDKLPQVAEEYYGLLAETVDVVGSEKHEWFFVERVNEKETKVTVQKRTREGEFRKTVYERTFTQGETSEIRLYGLSGLDRFEVTGNFSNGIRLRIIGGPGSDTYIDSTHVRRKSRARIYDTPTANEWHVKSSVIDKRSSDPQIHKYRYLGTYSYDRASPVLFLGSNTDDGLFLGGGVRIQKHGFRKDPYGQIHTIKGNYAPATNAFNVRYGAEFMELAGNWDGTLDVSLLSPNNIRNYFGLGNETENIEENEDYYRARFSEYRLAPGLRRTIQTGITFAIRPTFEITNFRQDEGRFITQPQAGISENTFEDQWFGGLELELDLKSVDSEINPKQGFRWQNYLDVNAGLENTSATFSTVKSILSIYYSPLLSPQITLATRLGMAHNIGNFPFFSSNTLGSRENLRGYINTRFAGRTSLYNNWELRTKLFDVSNYILGGDVGALGFFDTGRVWTDGENSDTWHKGYGGGFWLSIFEKAVVNVSVGFSEEGYYYTAGAGFFF